MTAANYNMNRETHDELFGLMEDSIEYFCNANMVSGELAWLVVQTIAEAKIAQFRGECV